MKDYIVTCDREILDRVYDKLIDYRPQRFKLLSGLALRVQDDKERSLLESLADIPGITYREAKTYKTLGERHD